MTLRQVVLPAPFGPIRLMISPLRMAKLTSESAFNPPNCLDSPCTSSIGGASAIQADGPQRRGNAVAAFPRALAVPRITARLAPVHLVSPADESHQPARHEDHHADHD